MYPERIEVVAGDITTMPVDAIVNAANSRLAEGAGVCGAIHRRAGPELAAACAAVGGCPTGEARLTPGFGLPARWVIHAVGPRWRGGGHDEAALLAGCYRSALSLARDHDIRTLAFPAISCGIYGYPVTAAAAIAVREVVQFLELDATLRRIYFCCFEDHIVRAYRAALAQFCVP